MRVAVTSVDATIQVIVMTISHGRLALGVLRALTFSAAKRFQREAVGFGGSHGLDSDEKGQNLHQQSDELLQELQEGIPVAFSLGKHKRLGTIGG